MMRTITVLVGLLLSTSQAWAQSRVYTNADLSAHPVTTWSRSVTADELAGLEARQFQGSPVQEWGPQVVILDSQATDGPFGAFPAFIPSGVAPGGVSFETVGPIYGGYGYGSGYGYGYGIGRSFGTHGRAHDRRPAGVPRVADRPRPVAPGRALTQRVIMPGQSLPLAPRPRRD